MNELSGLQQRGTAPTSLKHRLSFIRRSQLLERRTVTTARNSAGRTCVCTPQWVTRLSGWRLAVYGHRATRFKPTWPRPTVYEDRLGICASRLCALIEHPCFLDRDSKRAEIRDFYAKSKPRICCADRDSVLWPNAKLHTRAVKLVPGIDEAEDRTKDCYGQRNCFSD